MRIPKSKSPFRHPWWVPFRGLGETYPCLDEQLIVAVSNQIRAKPEWKLKYKNPEIVAKWRAELSGQDHKSQHVNEVFEYVLRELEWYDSVESTRAEFSAGGFKIGPDHRIVFSDQAIDEKTAKELGGLVADFEAANPKDYHPGSNNLVVDLVHPSLYHLEYGKTKVIEDGKLTEAKFDDEIGEFKRSVADWGISERFQWLPAELALEKSRKFVFDSYINNLHPIKYQALYNTIAEVFNRVIPGLNFTLARYLSKEYLRVPIPSFTDAYNEKFSEYEDKLNEYYENESFDEEKEEEIQEERKNYLGDFPPKYTQDPETKDFDVRDFSKLKVVVKLANIELTPEKPKYGGGSWHVEGTINEDIVATVLYYFDVENIKGSKLLFKNAYEEPEYEQGDSLYCQHFFGLNDEDKMSSYIGSVDSIGNRVIIFPNSFQHHVDPFELADPLKPGYRKILCFFIVDPYNDVVKSTKVVPPQQKEWVDSKELMQKYFPDVDPKDINTLTWEDATKLREELMAERTSAVADDDDFDNAFSRNFSLCEH